MLITTIENDEDDNDDDDDATITTRHGVTEVNEITILKYACYFNSDHFH